MQFLKSGTQKAHIPKVFMNLVSIARPELSNSLRNFSFSLIIILLQTYQQYDVILFRLKFRGIKPLVPSSFFNPCAEEWVVILIHFDTGLYFARHQLTNKLRADTWNFKVEIFIFHYGIWILGFKWDKMRNRMGYLKSVNPVTHISMLRSIS